MRKQGFPVLIEVSGELVDAGFRAPSTEKLAVIALQLRDRGWQPYKISFQAYTGAWVALVPTENSATVMRRTQDTGPKRV